MRVVSGFLFTIITGLILAVGCQGNNVSSPQMSSEENSAPVDSSEIPFDKIAVCVWEVAGLRLEPGQQQYTSDKKKNYLEAIYYGEEVEMLGEEKEVEDENRTYMKVRLKDDQVGWVHEYLFEKNAKLAAASKEMELYRRPDMMTLRDDKLLPGEIIVTMERVGEWLHISGREKKKKGWVKIGNEGLTFQKRDVKLALLYHKALQERSSDSRKEKLNNILDDKYFSGSVLLNLIEEIVKNGVADEGGKELNHISSNDEKLFITTVEAQIYSTPDTNSVLKALKKGDVCQVLGKGEQEEIKNMNDYWYRVKHEDEEGWIYGYYTSMRAPK